MSTAIQGVYVRDSEERTQPKPHTVYRIEIQAHVRSWQMWHRYSEFDDLHTELIQATGSPPPHPLPPKHKYSLLRSHKDPKLLEERRTGLEAYLRAIVSAKDDTWRESFPFKNFLGVPIGRQGTIQTEPTQFSSSSWLDEHIELQSQIRDVRADINKRDALADRGDVGASHTSNVNAKQKLAAILSRIGILGSGLRELAMGGMSQGELQRRTDMVARLQDDCEKLGKMVTTARLTSRGLGPSASTSQNPPPDSDREALLGAPKFSIPTTRVFGSAPKQPPQETEQTRPLDDQGLLGLQQVQMQQQDQHLSQLTTILQRQRHLGQAIGSEIEYQNELLDDLSMQVDSVSGKLVATNRQMNKLG